MYKLLFFLILLSTIQYMYVKLGLHLNHTQLAFICILKYVVLYQEEEMMSVLFISLSLAIMFEIVYFLSIAYSHNLCILFRGCSFITVLQKFFTQQGNTHFTFNACCYLASLQLPLNLVYHFQTHKNICCLYVAHFFMLLAFRVLESYLENQNKILMCPCYFNDFTFKMQVIYQFEIYFGISAAPVLLRFRTSLRIFEATNSANFCNIIINSFPYIISCLLHFRKLSVKQTSKLFKRVQVTDQYVCFIFSHHI